ncbi:MAG: hypothetical protein CMJ49_09105 [Planctomycetaceae bacterium]|nr:hypothetical protein [Planctomycetaceae bacterium]
MKTLDRYIIRQYLVNYAILFVAMVMLIMLLELIVNLDEFGQAAEKVEGGWIDRARAVSAATLDYFLPMIPLYFVYMSGLLAIGAAGFTLTGLIRNRELVAMLAGGVSMYRIAAPILVIGFAANVLLFVDQEFIIPPLKQKLGRAAADIKHGEVRPFEFFFVPDSNDWLFTAGRFDAAEQMMTNVTVLKRDQGRLYAEVTAQSAVWDADLSGWHLTQGYEIKQLQDDEGGMALVRDPRQIAFLPTDLDPTTLVLIRHKKFRQLLSQRELMSLEAKRQTVDVAEFTRIRLSRYSLPVLNMLMLVMCLPLFLMRVPMNMMPQSVKAAALGVGAWGAGFIMLQIGPAVEVSWLLTPAVIAWMPVVTYLPIAVYNMDSVES